MDLLPSPEQDEIASSSASFLADRMSIESSRTRVGGADAVDDGAWRAAAELGWLALGLPEDAGGIGCALADEALLFREIGRGLAPGPFLSTVLGARVAALGGAAALAESMIAGTSRVALVLPDVATTIDDGTVSGSLRLIDHVGAAHALALTHDRALLIDVAALDGLADEHCIDPLSRLASARARSVAAVASISRDVDDVAGRGLVLSAAMLVGIAEACRDISAEHARSRVQFDKPIGVNQAVKHPVADMAVRSELAWPQVVVAALSHDEGVADAEYQSISARLVAGEAADRNAAATIQVLGGMGFTYEHDANLYMKRAQVLVRTIADPGELLRRLLDLPAPD